MKVVILGGTGNISTSIVKLLLEKGHEVTCYNRGRSGDLPKDVRLIPGDRNDRETFEKTMQAEKFDAAIDMICFNPEDAASSIRAFREVAHFIQCSTVCTYGTDYRWLPVTEDHPLKPATAYAINKAEADRVFLEAYYSKGFPLTIIKPSTTYGPKIGMLRQIAWDFSWIDRLKKGKPILICGDGNALHQFMHVDDAAKGFAGVLGKKLCIGQTYNLVNRGFTTWKEHHLSAMKVLGVEAELVGVPLQTLMEIDKDRFAICNDIFVHNCYYSPEKLFRDVPEFCPSISLEEGMKTVFEEMQRMGTMPNSDAETWEDKIINAQRRVVMEAK